jgi:hypothetical protein
VLRSSLYSHFSESLSGLATIRAYKESDRFRLDNESRVDIENRFVYCDCASYIANSFFYSQGLLAHCDESGRLLRQESSAFLADPLFTSDGLESALTS